MARIVWVYAVAPFGFIIWVGPFISWVFYKGITSLLVWNDPCCGTIPVYVRPMS